MKLTSEQAAVFAGELRKQQTLFTRMKEMAGKLTDMVRSGGENQSEIWDVLGAKQRLMTEWEQLEVKLKPIKERWDEIRAGTDGAVLKEPEEALVSLRSTLKELIEAENEWYKLVEADHSDTADKIKQLQRGRKMNQAYGVKPPRDPKFWDQKQ